MIIVFNFYRFLQLKIDLRNSKSRFMNLLLKK